MSSAQPIYWSSLAKIKSRQESIFDLFAKLYPNKRPKEYWSLCGLCAESGKLIKGTELWHTLHAGIIKPAQFHGIDHDKNIIASNQSYPQAHWYQGDFLTILSQYPQACGIINFDSMNMPSTAIPYFLLLLAQLKPTAPTLVLANMVTRIYTRKQPSQMLVELLEKKPAFSLLQTKWNFYPKVYEYGGGRGNKNVTMCTLAAYPKHF